MIMIKGYGIRCKGYSYRIGILFFKVTSIFFGKLFYFTWGRNGIKALNLGRAN
jgi:hypothetical protein